MDCQMLSLGYEESSDEDDERIEETLQTEIDSAGTDETSDRNKVLRKRRRSPVWKHFTEIGGVGFKRLDGTSDIVCDHCKEHIVYDMQKHGTTPLLRHMKGCALTPGSTPKVVVRKIDMEVFREMIAVAIIEHDLPYSFVEYRRIREAFAYANSEIEFWCRNTAAADVLKVFEKEKKKLQKTLVDIPGRICFTTDLWRADTIEGYMCLTGHYIDADWNLQTKILSFCAFPPPHLGIAISLKLVELLKEWGLEKRVFALTVDNASSNDSMQGILKRQLQKDLVCSGEFFHVRCSAHILNLIVQDGLSVIGDALAKIRESIKFVTVTQSREKMFQSCCDTVGNELKAGLLLDVTTRWNSTHLMLSRAIQYKEAFRNLSEVEKIYTCFPSDLQ